MKSCYFGRINIAGAHLPQYSRHILSWQVVVLSTLFLSCRLSSSPIVLLVDGGCFLLNDGATRHRNSNHLLRSSSSFSSSWRRRLDRQARNENSHPTVCRSSSSSSSSSNGIAVPETELDQNLMDDNERTVVSVVRRTGPSVAFVTSVWPVSSTSSSTASSRRRGSRRCRRRRRTENDSDENDDDNDGENGDNNGTMLPRGRGLGSGSAFVVDARGYLVTNFHVIEQAYTLQQTMSQMDEFWNRTVSNNLLGKFLLQGANNMSTSVAPTPEIYVRLEKKGQNFLKCALVDVEPDLDIAVLKILPTNKKNTTSSENIPQSSYTPISFGSSSDLLVGQNLIAIGNPFGLQTTVTTGVVSALDRELQTSGPAGTTTSRPIRNCIQTDCAINPGNSGGPLLNSMGQVVGVNTAIVTTSGSNAGIGFAVPSDSVKNTVQRIIRKDNAGNKPYLGVSVISNTTIIESVERNSPADEVGMRGLRIFQNNATVQYGDAIVAVGGNAVETLDELRMELDRRSIGEQLPVTLERMSSSSLGEKRVVYLKLRARPQ